MPASKQTKANLPRQNWKGGINQGIKTNSKLYFQYISNISSVFNNILEDLIFLFSEPFSQKKNKTIMGVGGTGLGGGSCGREWLKHEKEGNTMENI